MADHAIINRCQAGYELMQQYRTTMEMWQGVPGGTISKIFDLSSIRTIYDAEADGRLNWGPCAYGKGIVGGALTLYVDNIAISPTRLYT